MQSEHQTGFEHLGLSSSILKAIQDKGYNTPSPIQAETVPVVIQGKDVMAAAQTGTGKTAGFTLPLLEKLLDGQPSQGQQPRVLILTPTRELAAQVEDNVKAYSKYTSLRSAVVFGGVKINPQIAKLKRGVDILVATPGRLLDLYNQKAVNFKRLEILVLDEADRMLDMGFIHDIRKILAILPEKRQNLLFSATFSDDIRRLAKGILHQPVEISVTPRNATAKTVEQWVHPVNKSRKTALLTHLIHQNDWHQVLVFSRTKHGANRLARTLEAKGIQAAAIHGNKSQGARTKALAEFKSGKLQALVATDIAARGIDIDQLPYVVNMELPNVAEDYVHRIGRTGRAGADGLAVSLVCEEENKLLKAIERLTQNKLPRKVIEGFEPTQETADQSTSDKKRPERRSGNRPDNKRRKATHEQKASDSRTDKRKRQTERVDAENTRHNRDDRKKDRSRQGLRNQASAQAQANAQSPWAKSEQAVKTARTKQEQSQTSDKPARPARKRRFKAPATEA